MGKIKKETREVFTTTDGEDFTNIDKARKHQGDISQKELAPELEKLICEMFKLPTFEEIEAMYDSDDDDSYEKSDQMESKVNSFLNDQCDGMGWFDEISELTKLLFGVYQAFGMEKLSDIFMFIDNKMEM